MDLLERLLLLLLLAIALLQVSRRLKIPYPALLSVAGLGVAMLPMALHIEIEPQLALALFIAPAVLDAAFDMPPRQLRAHWGAMVALAGVAVVLTTAAVAWAGMTFAHLSFASAIVLGALVAPPDTAAASAMMSQVNLPRRTMMLLRGESLLNDGVALLLYSVAVAAAVEPGAISALLPQFALAVPGGIVLGLVLGWVYTRIDPWMAGTLGGTLFEFVATISVWVLAERLHLSAVLAIVAYGMVVARVVPARQRPRDRLNSYSVWETAVFTLNVLAFLLLGLQARTMLARLETQQWVDVLVFALGVLAIVIVVRIAWIMTYTAIVYAWRRRSGRADRSSFSRALISSWCGMRGVVTMMAALALPVSYAPRDLIVLTALTVVVGTLVIQGLTLRPLIYLLKLRPDDSLEREMNDGRMALIDAAIDNLEGRGDEAAQHRRRSLVDDRHVAEDGQNPTLVRAEKALRDDTIKAKRDRLAQLRRDGAINEDVFHMLEEELDYAELATAPPEELQITES